jgi:hypothetical protein
MIGHQFEDFARKLIRAYNEVLFHELLMKETVRFGKRKEPILRRGG